MSIIFSHILQSLLDLVEPNRKAILAVGSLMHTFCGLQNDCSETNEVKQILTVFDEKLRYNCKTKNMAQHDQVIMFLKAIGNAGFASSLVPTLNRCFQNEKNPMEVRVTAINAFRRMACTAEVRKCYRFAPLKTLYAKQFKWQWVSNNLILSVVKDVPRPWFLTSLPSSVRFMCCVKNL